MTAKKLIWPQRNFILGTIVLVVGVILYASKTNPNNGHGAQSLRRIAYILIGVGCLNIFIGLIYYIIHSCTNNQPRQVNHASTSQIEPSIHVISVQEPVTEVRHRYNHDDPPPSYEEAIKNTLYSSRQFLHVPPAYSNKYNFRSNSFSNHQVLPTRSPIK